MKKSPYMRWSIASAIFLALASSGLLLGGIGIGAGEPVERLIGQDGIVPQGRVLHVVTKGLESSSSEEYFIDPGSRVVRVVRSVDGGPESVSVFDQSGHTTLNGVTLEVYSADANYDSVVSVSDPYAGIEVTRTGTEAAAGRSLIVWEGEFSGPGSESRFSLRTLVDDTTGLRVLDELRVGTTLVASTTREWIPLRELSVDLWSRLALSEEAVTIKSKRKADLAGLSYPVFGLPEGYQGVRLLRIIPGVDWSSVRIEYQMDDTTPGAEVVVTTFDPTRIPDYPAAYLQTVEAAVTYGDEVGQVILFGKSGVGVKVQVASDQSKANAKDAASALVVVN